MGARVIPIAKVLDNGFNTYSIQSFNNSDDSIIIYKDMIQLELTCKKCFRALCFLLSNDNSMNLICPYCSADCGRSTPASGFLYALRNLSMPGLLKIGFTTRPVEERVLELDSSTATPTPFEIAFYFSCSEPQSDEAIAHETLLKHRINQSREFFKITEKEALSILRETLSRKEVFLNRNLRDDDLGMFFEIKGLDESLKNEVLQMRERWSSTEGASIGISLIYRLMSERRYSDAKQIVSLFLKDNPGHLVALAQNDIINAALKKW